MMTFAVAVILNIIVKMLPKKGTKIIMDITTDNTWYQG